MRHWAQLLAKKGMDVHFISFTGSAPENGIKFHKIQPIFPHSYIQFLININKVKRVVNKVRPDILHSYYLTNYALLASLIGFKPLIVTVAGSDLFWEPTRSPLLRLIVKFVLNKATVVHSVAEHMTLRLTQWGVSYNKIITLPEGVARQKFHAINVTRRGEKVISTRNFKPLYNLQLLIEAIPYVVDVLPYVKFILIGDGPERDKLIEKAKSLGIYDHIDFHGKVCRDEIPYYLRSAEVYVTTSLSDGTSASLLEAMACGLFPIATDIPANREWIKDGITGYLVPIKDPRILAEKIIIALRNASLRERAKVKNLELIKSKADDEIIIQRLIERYRELLS